MIIDHRTIVKDSSFVIKSTKIVGIGFIIVLMAAMMLSASLSYAGQKAITDTGDQIILNSDGTWTYVNKDTLKSQNIEVNPVQFTRPKDSTFQVKSERNKAAVWINPEKWLFRKSENNNTLEYEFKLKDDDLYAMIVTERIEVPLDSLADIALNNARSAAPDAKIMRHEYRMLNGKKVLYLEINGTIKGINFEYFGYYFSNSSGTTQLITYTSSNLVPKLSPEISSFLDGLDEQQ